MGGRSENESEPARRKNWESPAEQKSPPRAQSKSPSGETGVYLMEGDESIEGEESY